MRIAQLNLIFPIISQYPNSFFMGDFNFPEASEEEKHIPNKFNDMWTELHKGATKEQSDTTERGRYDKLLYATEIFVGTSVSLVGTEPLTELSTPEEVVYPSDHKGLYGEFSTKSECCRD